MLAGCDPGEFVPLQFVGLSSQSFRAYGVMEQVIDLLDSRFLGGRVR